MPRTLLSLKTVFYQRLSRGIKLSPKRISTMLMIGERLRAIRESKNLSQGHIEKRTGLVRCYTSRVENGHTVPSIETLAKFAQHSKFRSINFFTMVKRRQRR